MRRERFSACNNSASSIGACLILKPAYPPIARDFFGDPLMSRMLTGVLFLALSLALFGCGSSGPMRFQFSAGGQPLAVKSDEAGTGDQTKVFELRSNDTDKEFEFTLGGKKIFAKMDVYSHTELTRISVVPIYLTSDIAAAVSDYKAVTYVVYQRRRDVSNTRRTGSAGEDVELKVYDYGDTVTRDALIEQARLQGTVIAVIDFGSAKYIK